MTMTPGRLDCGSPDLALLSFSQIVGVQPEEVQRRCRSFDLQDYYESASPNAPAWDVVYQELFSEAERRRQPAAICWFHATRTTSNVDFATAGILPTVAIANQLWQVLRRIDPEPPPDHEWADFRRSVEAGASGHWSGLYGIKIKHGGPFGFLIREELSHLGQTSSVNYLRCPETVEDICICYEECFGHPLLQAYLAATRPCIVKFIDRRPARVLSTVALYLYRRVHGQAAYEVNTCFDSQGVAIGGDQVLGIEWPAG